jgi:hypothetical protein
MTVTIYHNPACGTSLEGAHVNAGRLDRREVSIGSQYAEIVVKIVRQQRDVRTSR